MLRPRAAHAAVFLAGALAYAQWACSPTLQAPRESIRITGTVQDVVEKPTPTPAVTATPTPTATPSEEGAPTPTPTPVKIAKPKPLRSFPTLTTLPLGVAVYEACSPQLYLFKRCPGRFLGEAKLAHPGPFVVEIDTQATEIVVFAYRGFLGPEQQQEACAEQKIAIADAGKPIALQLEPGTCSIKLEKRYG